MYCVCICVYVCVIIYRGRDGREGRDGEMEEIKALYKEEGREESCQLFRKLAVLINAFSKLLIF